MEGPISFSCQCQPGFSGRLCDRVMAQPTPQWITPHTSAPSSTLFSEKSLTELTGKWQNQIGSFMYLNVSEEGHLSGQYSAVVGPTSGGWYPLIGRVRTTTNPTKYSPFAILAWIVDWKNDNEDLQSMMTWNGEWLSDDTLQMVWTLVVHSDSDTDVWGNTRTKADRFFRTD